MFLLFHINFPLELHLPIYDSGELIKTAASLA